MSCWDWEVIAQCPSWFRACLPNHPAARQSPRRDGNPLGLRAWRNESVLGGPVVGISGLLHSANCECMCRRPVIQHTQNLSVTCCKFILDSWCGGVVSVHL